ILSAYSLCVALVWHWRRRLIDFATWLHMLERMKADDTPLTWLSGLIGIALATIGVLAYSIDLRSVDFNLRVTAALAFLAQCLTVCMLAEGVEAKDSRR